MAICNSSRKAARAAGSPSIVSLALSLALALTFGSGQAWGAKPKAKAKAKPAAAAKAKDACRSGLDLLSSGDVLKAIKALDKCVDQSPDNHQAWASLGSANLEAGRFNASADAFARAHKLKPGNAELLGEYLQALEGTGRKEERVAVFRALLALKPGDQKVAAGFLQALEAAGPSRYPDDHAAVLEILAARHDADPIHAERLAAAYLAGGRFDKAEAEYRGLLARRPESPEYWAGLGASQVKANSKAAAECYSNAALYSSQAAQREAYQAEADRLAGKGDAKGAKAVAKAGAAPGGTKAERKARAAEEKRAKAEKAKQEKLAREAERSARAEAERLLKEEAERRAQREADSLARAEADRRAAVEAERKAAAAAQAARAKEEKEQQDRVAGEIRERQEKAAAERKAKDDEERLAPAKAVDLKAYQDSIYKAELEKRLAEMRKASPPAAPAAAAPAPGVAAKAAEEKARQDKAAKDAEAKARAEQELKDKLAREEKQREEKAREEAERLAKEEKKRQEKARADSLAKAEVERKAVAAAEKKAREEAERLAKEEKKRQELARADSLAKAEVARKAVAAAEKKAREEAERLAKEEKKRRELARADSLAKAEVARKAAAAAEKKAREEAERLAKEEKKRQELARADSLAKAEVARKAAAAAEQKAREERERLAREAEAKAQAAARAAAAEAERLAREEKARQDKLRADSLARAEAERKALAEAQRKAREEAERVARELAARREQARRDSLARAAAERRERAFALYREGRLDSAAAVFRVVLAEGHDSEAYYYAGRTHLDLKQWDKALALLEKAPASKPDIDGLKGKALMGLGRNQEALAGLERQYQRMRDDALLEDLVQLKRKNGDEPGALAYLERLAEARPREARYQEELATQAWKRGDKAKALERYGKLLSIDPSHAEANFRLGLDWSSQGVHDRAAPMLERAMAAYPDRGIGWKALGKAQAALGRRDEAWASYRKAQALLPQDLDIAKAKVALARSGGRPDELTEAFRDLLKLAPLDPDAAMGLAKLRFQAADYAEAERLFRIACPPSRDGAAWAQYGRSLRENKKPNEAVAALLKAVELGEGGMPLRLELAHGLFETGGVDRADLMAKEIAKNSPADPEPWYLQGRVAMSRQQVAVAEEHYRKANRLRPDHARYAEAVARLSMDRDEYRQALSALSAAEPGLSPEGRLMLADCHAAAGDGSRALEGYAQVEKRQPSARVLARRIDMLVRMGKAEKGLEAARGSAFAGSPEVMHAMAKAQLALAQSHVLKADLEQAVALMKKVLKTDGHNPEFHLHLGMAWYLQGRYGKAADAFAGALMYRQGYPEALYHRGLSLIKEGSPREAEDLFVELSQSADSLWKARGLYGRSLVFQSDGKPEAVEHHLALSIGARPTADAMAAMARVNLRAGKLAEAEEWAKRALLIDRGHEDATLALAEALSAGKKYPEAMGLARQALQAKPLSCGLLVQTAKLSYEAGRLDSTLASSDQAIRACPEEPMGYYYAGMAQRGASRPEEAKRYFKSFRKLGGDKKLIPE